MSIREKKVIVIGGTGVGKSTVGNRLLGEQRFVASSGGQSVTNEIKSFSKIINLPSNFGPIQLHVVDTPGIGDTQGRTVKFLDSIIQYIRENTINMIIIVVTKDRLTEMAKKYLLAMKECLKEFNDATTVLVINKMPRTHTLQEDRTGPQTMEDCENETKREIFAQLKCAQLVNVISIPNDPTEPERENFRQRILGIIRSSREVNRDHLQTWTERLNHYQGILDGKISDNNGVQQLLNELIAQRNNIQSDLEWHQNRVHDLTISVKAVGWIPFVGTIAAAGMQIAIADSNSKIPVLQQQLQEIRPRINAMTNETTRHQELVRNAQATVNRMRSIFPQIQ